MPATGVRLSVGPSVMVLGTEDQSMWSYIPATRVGPQLMGCPCSESHSVKTEKREIACFNGDSSSDEITKKNQPMKYSESCWVLGHSFLKVKIITSGNITSLPR